MQPRHCSTQEFKVYVLSKLSSLVIGVKPYYTRAFTSPKSPTRAFYLGAQATAGRYFVRVHTLMPG